MRYEVSSRQVKLLLIWRMKLIPYLLGTDFPLGSLTESWHSGSHVLWSLGLTIYVDDTLMKNIIATEAPVFHHSCLSLLYSKT